MSNVKVNSYSTFSWKTCNVLKTLILWEHECLWIAKVFRQWVPDSLASNRKCQMAGIVGRIKGTGEVPIFWQTNSCKFQTEEIWVLKLPTVDFKPHVLYFWNKIFWWAKVQEGRGSYTLLPCHNATVHHHHQFQLLRTESTASCKCQ